MKRWAFNVLAGISLLLCVMVAVLWVRSYWVYDAFNWERPSPNSASCFSFVASRRGLIEYKREVRDYLWRGPKGYFEYSIGIFFAEAADVSPGHPGPALLPKKWFWEWETFEIEWSDRNFTMTFPHGVLLLVGGILPVLWLWRRIHCARQRNGEFCLFCGYDLRATPERCPECGTEVKMIA